jgi:hypothetical protein
MARNLAQFLHTRWEMTSGLIENKIFMAGKPVSRILFGVRAVRPACRSDHSSRSRFAPGLQQPTRGS